MSRGIDVPRLFLCIKESLQIKTLLLENIVIKILYIFAVLSKYSILHLNKQQSKQHITTLNHIMRKKILLVDDKETIAKVASIYLGKDYDFQYVQNPIKAIEWLNEGNLPDLIISDIRMPEMRGDEFLHYLKHNELFNDIPVIMLSSEESTTERIRLLEEGAEDYILKPFNPMELKIRVRKIIE